MADSDGFENLVVNPDENELRENLSTLIVELYPILLQRIERSEFAKWYRLNGLIEDLAQETIQRFFRHCCKTLSLPNEPLNYIVRIAKYTAYEKYRRSEKIPLDIAAPIPEDTVVTDCSETSEERYSEAQMELLRIAVDMLPKRQREAYELRNKNPGATDKELGEKMGTGEDGFRKQSKRAFDRMREFLSQ